MTWGRHWRQSRAPRSIEVQTGGMFVHCEWNSAAVAAAFRSNHVADWTQGAKVGAWGHKHDETCTKLTLGVHGRDASPPCPSRLLRLWSIERWKKTKKINTAHTHRERERERRTERSVNAGRLQWL